MGSFTFGRLSKAVSEGAGLFATREIEKERERIKQQWDLQMEDLRAKRQGEAEERQIGREETRLAADTARFEAGQETQRARDASTAKYRKDTLAQGDEQFGRKMDAEMVADEKKALRDRLEGLYDTYQERVEASLGTDDGSLAIDYAKAKDEAVAAFVMNMASARDSKGEQGAPGFKNITTPEALASKMITYGMQPEFADVHAGDIMKRLNPPPDAELELLPSMADVPQRTQRPPGYETAESPTAAAASTAAPVSAPQPRITPVAPGSQGMTPDGGDPTHSLRSPVRSPFRGLTDEERAANPGDSTTHRLQVPLQSPFEKILYGE